MNKERDKRLMVFTSLLRTLNFVGHSRVDQCCGMFVKFESEFPITHVYSKTDDHRNMRKFIDEYNLGDAE